MKNFKPRECIHAYVRTYKNIHLRIEVHSYNINQWVTDVKEDIHDCKDNNKFTTATLHLTLKKKGDN